MATYSWDPQGDKPAPVETELELISNDGILASPFTGAIQTIVRPKIWRYTCTWRNISGGERADLLAFFLRLNGTEHRVRLPFFGQVQRGTYGGTPVIDGAGQTGHTLAIRGATTNVTNWIRAGDVIRWGGTLHMATVDADSDGAGGVSVDIIPEIRDAPADATTLFTGGTMTGIWILETNVQYASSALKRLSSGDIVGDLQLSFIDDVVNA